MRALIVRTLDGPESMLLDEVPEPEMGPGSVLVEVSAAGMAFPDLLLTRGLYQYKPDPPFIPGSEVAGRVVSAPAGSGWSPGQPVAAYPTLGGFAERVTVPEDRVFPLPADLDVATAAAMPINYLTMHFGLCVRGRLAAGETVAVHGAGGGLGLAAIQVARAWGARVIAIASSEDKRQIALAAGADLAIPVDGFREALIDITEGRGVDVIADPVGGDRVTDSLRSLQPCGRFLVLGFTSGEIVSVKTNRLLLNNLDVVGVGWGAYASTHPGYMRQQWDALMEQFTHAAIRPVAPEVVSLEEIPTKLREMEDRTLSGKIVAVLAPRP